MGHAPFLNLVRLIYGFHQRKNPVQLSVKPFMVDHEVGIFASRAPVRPNGLGLSLAEVDCVKSDRVQLLSVDMIDGSPLFDIKPFFGKLEVPEVWQTGWLAEAKKLAEKPFLADKRFSSDPSK